MRTSRRWCQEDLGLFRPMLKLSDLYEIWMSGVGGWFAGDLVKDTAAGVILFVTTIESSKNAIMIL